MLLVRKEVAVEQLADDAGETLPLGLGEMLQAMEDAQGNDRGDDGHARERATTHLYADVDAGRPYASPDLAEVHAFVVAARTGSLSRAAVELRVSTPAVAKRVRNLEALAGTSLLVAALFEPAAVGHIGLGRPLTSVIEGRSGSYGILAVYGRAGCVAPDEHAVFLDVVASVLGVAVRRMGAEAALGDREVTLTAFFDAAADPMLIADDDRRYVDANAAALDVLGYTRDELLALRIEDLLPPPIVDEMDVRWQAFLAQGTVRGSGEVRRKDGSPLAVEYHSRAPFMPGRHLTVLRLLPPPR